MDNTAVEKYTTIISPGFTISLNDLELQDAGKRFIYHCWEDQYGNIKHKEAFIKLGFITNEGKFDADRLRALL